MLTKPRYWDELWGADGTRCSYRILTSAEGVIPPVGAHIETPSGYVYRVEGLSSTDVDATRIGHIGSFPGEIPFFTTKDTEAPITLFSLNSIFSRV
jgi:hypothetical protein